jgi:CRP-like cAMP-binding protein
MIQEKRIAMADGTDRERPQANRLLAALPDWVYERLVPSLEPISLTLKQILYQPNGAIPYVYFPLTMVTSLVILMQDGQTVEVATVGNEGMVGLPAFLGAESFSGQAFTQVPGDAVRMQTAVFRDTASPGSPLHDVLHRYTQALLTQVAQSAACNRLHSIDQRCARWLLMTEDRARADRFPLTQEFLAQMLGVRRAGVSEAASRLQKAELIQYSRGVITVLDRAGLEAAACECYAIIKQEYDRLLTAATG